MNIFYDDLEAGNPLGSHAGVDKFGVFYAQIACLPVHIASQIISILFSTLIMVNDKKHCTNQNCFRKLIDEINYLQTIGIEIIIDGIPRKIKFQIALIIGDNLGLNGILGFNELFISKSWCRICKATAELAAKLTGEDESLLRNRENYEKDVKQGNPSESGIKEECAFHKMYNFHLTENVCVDFMHDV